MFLLWIMSLFHNKNLKEFSSKGLNHIPILPLNPDPIIKELCDVWIKVASIMHFNVKEDHFEVIKEITTIKFFELFPNYRKNQQPWFFEKDLLNELNS